MKKKIILIFFILICIGCVLYCSILCYKNIIAVQTETDVTDGKEITKEEYLYKEDLLHLGYSINNINVIEKKISNIDVKNYLLSKKYNNLIEFLPSPYFNIAHISRYQNYYDRTSYTAEVCVLYVEMGLDYDFYTNISETDTSKRELMIVNKYNALDSNYVPVLYNLSSTYGSGKLESTAHGAFINMCDAARLDNIKLWSVSAYRSYSTQESIYNSYVKRNGQEKADTFSARPGHSEHQTGLAVDINTASSSANFQNTEEYQWLINNSYKYGFILRYPDKKNHITGYKYEPWHYRYVGIDVATKIFLEDITFEEYIVKYLSSSY